MLQLLVRLFEQFIVQPPGSLDIWDILCLVPNSPRDHSFINQLVDRLVSDYNRQPVEFRGQHFSRFKQCLYHLHRLACPWHIDTCEHLTSLLVYHVLLIVRDYLRLFTYEPNNRHFVDSAAVILRLPPCLQNIDCNRIKYAGDQQIVRGKLVRDSRHYQLHSFTASIDWISAIVFQLMSYLRLQYVPPWLRCQEIFRDFEQLRWLREFVIYFHILNKIGMIPNSRIATLNSTSLLVREREAATADATNSERDVIRDIYDSMTKFALSIQGRRVALNWNEGSLSPKLARGSYAMVFLSSEKREATRRGSTPGILDF